MWLSGGTAPLNYLLFGGTVPLKNLLFRGTVGGNVPPNTYLIGETDWRTYPPSNSSVQGTVPSKYLIGLDYIRLGKSIV